MSTQDDDERGEGTEGFRDSGLDQDGVADAFDAMESASGGGALLEGEEDGDEGRDRDDEEDTAEEAEGGADVASGGGEGEREPTSGAVGERAGGDRGDGRGQDDDRG